MGSETKGRRIARKKMAGTIDDAHLCHKRGAPKLTLGTEALAEN
jgi:hypothetical protein